MRRAPAVAPGDWLRAFVLVFKHPVIALGPLAASVLGLVAGTLVPAGDGGFAMLNGTIASLIAVLINSLGLAFALIAADAAWSYGRVSIRNVWQTVQRRMGDIFMAGLGYAFVQYIATFAGSILGSFGLPGFSFAGPLLVTLLATFFLLYTIPAAAIGGVPGMASLNTSVERARESPYPTLLLLLLYYVTYIFARPLVSMFAGNLLLGFGVRESLLVSTLTLLALQALLGSYYALMLAKTYNGISYRRVW